MYSFLALPSIDKKNQKEYSFLLLSSDLVFMVLPVIPSVGQKFSCRLKLLHSQAARNYFYMKRKNILIIYK